MKKLLYIVVIAMAVMAGVGVPVAEQSPAEIVLPTFDDAIAVIKKYEGLHSARHWPLVGYGHKVLPGDRFKRGKALSEAEADKLLRKDLAALCARYRAYGPDSLLLAALAYNIGIGNVAKSGVINKLKQGNRDFKVSYLAHCKYRGKTNSQLKRRRTEEFNLLYIKDEVLLALPKPEVAAADNTQNEA